MLTIKKQIFPQVYCREVEVCRGCGSGAAVPAGGDPALLHTQVRHSAAVLQGYQRKVSSTLTPFSRRFNQTINVPVEILTSYL